jgi:hypothetical protein
MSPLARLLVIVWALLAAMAISGWAGEVRPGSSAPDASALTAADDRGGDPRMAPPDAVDTVDDDPVAADEDGASDPPEAITVQRGHPTPALVRLVTHAPAAARAPPLVHLDTETPPPRA